uniref:Uncharacterized protein n=1 Tax=Attheya septentrionalis TaxID=420275 RepID=A0A7S2U9L4_9STRA|mmetsp:Transcript_16243/g.29549  ORF Transcript_16243/g.29549 Transcript_16243/m.29549 type:complete len:270 (+) Transcript_16243:216-1025(+)|eukprot:CAMPEP_0198285570 /NCGR_PEP_ID=MMETSP1449-20131203/4826_1 /TAXON_ID=420275 /ORGANISM="Attheya septentrionalis, Strain CCMP2084" /LENGTH=269 /DNA_ID=CAMNT_0043983033 /DNA_START=142 /DNA_END=951 /DNA_ORIENTATION=+
MTNGDGPDATPSTEYDNPPKTTESKANQPQQNPQRRHNHDSSTDTLTKSPHTTSRAKIPKEQKQWLERSLSALGHVEPSSFGSCLTVGTKEADDQLQAFVTWLEDRVIRQWDIESRNGLRNDFWTILPRYLNDLDCPPMYYAYSGKEGEEGRNKDDPVQRVQIVHWLVSCGVSDLAQQQQEEEEDNRPSPSLLQTKNEWKASDFPLGFSTNDDTVDHIATAIRMRYIVEMRRVQDKVNQRIAEMQRSTSTAHRQQRTNLPKTKKKSKKK